MRIDLSQPNGMSVSCINYGARLILACPGPGRPERKCCLGLVDAEAYGNDQAHPSARPLDQLPAGSLKANGDDSAGTERRRTPYPHGGSRGWGQQFWGLTIKETAEAVTVTFTLESTPEAVGYPGRLQAKTNTYTLDAEGCLTITMTGACSEETLFNPTSHIYFNLSGEAKRPITEHTLQLACEEVLELDTDKLPTGKKRAVDGTGFRFPRSDCYRRRHSKKPEGFDDVFLMHSDEQKQLVLSDAGSGREMALSSNRSSIVLFSTTDMNEPYAEGRTPDAKPPRRRSKRRRCRTPSIIRAGTISFWCQIL